MKKSMLLMVLLVLVTVFNSFIVAFGEEDLGTWETKRSMRTARRHLGVIEANGKIYAIGGSNKTSKFSVVEEYDPVTDTWTTKESMLTARDYLAVAEANGKIYAIGGYNGSNHSNVVEEYDPVTDTWTTKESMLTARSELGVATVNGKIYAIGGNSGGTLHSTVEEYDPVTDKWTTKESMPNARYALGVIEANGKIYAIGGANSSYSNVVEEYDPVTDKWTTKESMPTARMHLGVVEANGKIYAIGGSSIGTYHNTVEEYDSVTDKWTTKESMRTGRYGLGVAEANGKIYAIGGYNRDYLNVVEEYTPPASIAPDKPLNLTAIAGDSKVDLSWDGVTDADSYIVKRSTTRGGPYTTIAEDITVTNYTDTDVINGTTYYYVVSAILSGIESENSNEASATPEGGSSSGDGALLRITMSNDTINEYDLSIVEIKDFIDWYKDRGDGRGNPYYIFNKDYNIGPFTSRKDYIAFDKISQFEVMEYNR